MYKGQQQQQRGSLEFRTSVIEEGMEIYEESLEGLRYQVKILLAHINILNEWISSNFEVELINKESLPYKHISSDDTEELDEITRNLLAQPAAAAAEAELAQPFQSQNIVETVQEDLNLPNTVTGYRCSLDQHIYPQFQQQEQQEQWLRNFDITNSLNQEEEMAIELDKDKSSSTDSKTKNSDESNPARKRESVRCQVTTTNLTGKKVMAAVKKVQSKGQLSLACRYCERTLATRFNLRMHERSHTGEKPFRCPICHQRFTRARVLKVHMWTHTGQKPHVCHICSHSFAQRDALNGHLNWHRGHKPFQCHLCHQKFYSKFCRQQHVVRVHNVDKPWSCYKCGVGFETNNGLKIHISKHFRNGDLPEQQQPPPYNDLNVTILPDVSVVVDLQ